MNQHGGFSSAANQVFGLQHLRQHIFDSHYDQLKEEVEQKELESIPITTVGSDFNSDKARFLNFIKPFLRIHGFRSATYDDLARRRPEDSEYALALAQYIRKTEGPDEYVKGPHGGPVPPLAFERVEKPKTTLLRDGEFTLVKEENILRQRENSGKPLRFGTGLIDCIVPIDDDLKGAPLMMRLLPRESQTAAIWRYLYDHRPEWVHEQECPLLPTIALLDYGKKSSIILSLSPKIYPEHSFSSTVHNRQHLRRRIERVKDALNGLAWLHKNQITLNSPILADQTFISSYAKRTSTHQTLLGHSSKHFNFAEELPQKPSTEHFPLGPEWTGGTDLPGGLPWSEIVANTDPRVPGPRLWIADLPHATYKDEEIKPDQLQSIKEEYKCSPFIRDFPPEDEQKQNETKLDRIKRDIFNMGLFIVGEIFVEAQGKLVKDYRAQLSNLSHSQRYESGFKIDVKELPELPDHGPDDESVWGVPFESTKRSSNVPPIAAFPAELGKLALEMTDPDPSKRPSASDCAKRAQIVHDEEIPKIVDLYEKWIKAQTIESKTELQAVPLPQTEQEKQAYTDEIRKEDPSSALFVEHSLGRYLDVNSIYD